jgi:hypothetical protein
LKSAVRRLATAAFVLAATLWTATAWAATVLIVRPANPSPAMAETLVRIDGELISVGFGVELVDASALGGNTSREALDRLAEQRGADAVVAIIGDAAPNSVEVWVVDRVTGKSVMRRLSRAELPETLAVRAIELLRSSFLEIELAPRGRAALAQSSPTVVRFVEGSSDDGHRERFGLGIGAAAMFGTDGIGPAIVPELRFDWKVRPSWLLQAALGGFGTRPAVANGADSARISQQYALIGSCYRLRPTQRVGPFGSFALGALHTTVDGEGVSPNEGQTSQQWSLLVDIGLGTSARLHDRFYLALAAHVQLAQPYVAVRFIDKVVATSGRPNLVLTLTLGAWL